MIKSSKICTLIISALKWIYETFKDSFLYKALLGIVNFFADGYASSKFRKIIIGKNELEDFSDTSVFYRVFGGVIKAVMGLVCNSFGKICNLAKGSAVQKLYNVVFQRPFEENYIYFVSFLMALIFIIPHDFWFNIFGMVFAVLLLVLYVFYLSLRGKDAGKKLSTGKLWFSVLVFGFSLLLSCFVSYDRADSIRVLMFFITAFVLCFVVFASVKDKNGLNIICGFMYGALTFTSVIAIVQRLLGIEADAALTDLALNENMPGRVFSTLGNPNNYAEFLVLFMPFAFAFALNMKKGRKRDAVLCGMLLPVLAILLTYSRSGWIALAIAVVIFVSIYDKKLIPIFIALVLLAIPFIPQNILHRILTIGNLKDSSSSYRVDIWTGCIRMLKDYWFTGVGLGTGGFAEIYPDYAVGTSGVAPHSHMHFMEMLCELGVLGFISYVCMTFTLIKRSFTASSRRVSTEVRNVAIASAASMTGIIMIGCFEYCWFYPRVMFAFFLCAGIAMAAHKIAKNECGTLCA